jgi:putative transposase
MEENYRNKYRICSSRLTAWDYGSHGLYFVTICTKDRIRYFGEIENTDMGIINDQNKVQSIGTQSTETQSIASLRVTDIGKIAYNNWLQITQYHPYVELDEFVIMPDHIHGVLFINKPEKTSWDLNKFGAQKNNLASIVRGYKSSVKQYATVNGIDFFWQPRYYDRVIRNEKEHANIREYIYRNPHQWLLNEDWFENLFTP